MPGMYPVIAYDPRRWSIVPVKRTARRTADITRTTPAAMNVLRFMLSRPEKWAARTNQGNSPSQWPGPALAPIAMNSTTVPRMEAANSTLVRMRRSRQ